MALGILKFRWNNEKKKFENAKKLLDNCWFVGIVEKSDEDFKFLLESMGFKNPEWTNVGVTKRIIQLDENLLKKIYEENPLDVKIYKYALELNKRKKLIYS